MKAFRNIALAVVVLITVMVTGLCGIYKYMLSPIGKDTKTIEVEIPTNSSRSKIAKILKENKLIRDENFFLLYVKLFKIVIPVTFSKFWTAAGIPTAHTPISIVLPG